MRMYRRHLAAAVAILAAAIMGVPSRAADLPPAANTLPDGLLPATNYPIPAGALHVSASGDAPYRTIGAAVTAAPAGATIVVDGGVYRETIPATTKPLTIQAAPGQRPWIVGTKVLTAPSFAQVGQTYVLSGWTFAPACRDPYGQELQLSFTHRRAAEAVFIDGKALTEVATAAEVRPGTFYVSRSTDKLIIGDNPASRVVEATVREYAFNIKAPGTALRGLGFARFASSVDPGCRPAMVWTNPGADGVVVEDSVFTQSSSDGLAVRSRDVVVRNNVFDANGSRGVSADRGYGLRLVANRITANNADRFVTSGVYGLAGGTKLTRMGWNPTDGVDKRLVVTDNLIADNYGKGLWCDLACGRSLIARNVVARNSDGIFFEVSHAGDIVSNVVVSNAGFGIRVGGSRDVRVLNNTAVDNTISWGFLQDPRRIGTSADCFAGPSGRPWLANPCRAENTRLVGNLSQHTTARMGKGPCGAADEVRSLAFYTCNAAITDPGADAMFAVMDDNAYVRTPELAETRLIKWVLPRWGVAYAAHLSSLRDNTRFEDRGLDIVRGASVLADLAAGDYQVVDPALVAAGAPLPADLALELGVSAIPARLGAFAWSGRL